MSLAKFGSWLILGAVAGAAAFLLHRFSGDAAPPSASTGSRVSTAVDPQGAAVDREPADNPVTAPLNRSASRGVEKPLSAVLASVLRAADVGDAVMQARAAYGESDELANIERLVVGACATDVDPYGTLFKGPPDQSRLWAAQALVERCKGWDKVPPSTWRTTFDSPVQTMKSRGKEAALELAMRVIRTSDAFAELHEAGVLLIESGDSRILDVPGAEPGLGTVELIGAWIYASALWECDSQGGCGPDHLRTLAYCVTVGCREGSTYRDAVTSATPAREMRTVDAFLAWIRANRR
ncbi:MAG TPA: hypothetical protein VJ724_13390 [Tahibacter sp.]|nr:hypothetical protein [Tahibacter sp.]